MPLSYKHLTLQQIRDIALKEARRFLSQDDAEDIASTVMLELAGTDVRRTAFVAKRARWRVSDLMRQDLRRLPDNLSYDEHGFEEVHGELVAEKMLRRCTPIEGEAIRLASDGFTPGEIAERMGRTYRSAQSLTYHARQKLAKV